ncbi:MAG: OB-fold nucleic acid binding domain-containing protein, partial [Caldilineaceae bacterium]
PILAETYGIIVYQEQIIQILSQLAGYSPGDADLVRRAVGKKKASDIEKHKKTFVQGCQDNGIEKKIAEDIYGDIEFFARYGFNKSHAADYAVITVQTAYLKAHYPVEYMAALLLVERNKTEKVVNFIQEARRMGIDVLPPDVNYSGMDFEIQELPKEQESAARRDDSLAFDFPVPEASAIRFGMAAVKNVGEGPVQTIIDARNEGGPFASLEDFCDRVDLRQVNKRALECLVKVGALDRFGHRSQLLGALDAIVGQSASVFNARESGQLSMFELMGDMDSGHVASIQLPAVEPESGRDRLSWEKELLGVYAMSHPMQHISVDIRNIVSCQCNELDARFDGKNVTIVGMITGVRPINTKKGERMAFVQIEDMQGQCEVVVFPRTYDGCQDRLVEDSIVVVKGKAQTREGQTSLLADQILNYVEYTTAADKNDIEYQKPLIEAAPTINGARVEEEYDDGSYGLVDNEYDDVEIPPMETSPFRDEPPTWGEEMVNGGAGPVRHTSVTAGNKQTDNVIVESNSDVSLEGPGRIDRKKKTMDRPVHGDNVRGDAEPAEGAEADIPGGQRAEVSTVTPTDDSADVNGKQQMTNGSAARRNGPRTLVITFRPTGNLERDKYRLKEIYESVRDPRGRDVFELMLQVGAQSIRLAFPNDQCTISERTMTELDKRFRVEAEIV